MTEICPANASFQMRFNPDLIRPDDILREVKAIEGVGAKIPSRSSKTRIIEIPVFYNDPWTHETLMRFRERHQEPGGTDLDYAAQINGYGGVDDFITAHAGSPWFVSMVGFVRWPAPSCYQMVERQRQIEVPKYLSPRTDTPKLTVGHGGCFGCIYSVRGAGGYQMFGVTPMPIFDPTQQDELPARFHGVLPSGRHRQVQAGRSRRIRPRRSSRCRQKPSARRSVRSGLDLREFQQGHRRLQRRTGGAFSTAIKVLHPGLSTSVQDLGRPGYFHLGIPIGGAMDRYAMRAANLLVGNDGRGSGLWRRSSSGQSFEFMPRTRSWPSPVPTCRPSVDGEEQAGLDRSSRSGRARC